MLRNNVILILSKTLLISISWCMELGSRRKVYFSWILFPINTHSDEGRLTPYWVNWKDSAEGPFITHFKSFLIYHYISTYYSFFLFSCFCSFTWILNNLMRGIQLILFHSKLSEINLTKHIPYPIYFQVYFGASPGHLWN